MKPQIFAIFEIVKIIKNPEISEIAVSRHFHISTFLHFPSFFLPADADGWKSEGGWKSDEMVEEMVQEMVQEMVEEMVEAMVEAMVEEMGR